MTNSSEGHISAFRDAMAKEGLAYSGPIDADGRLHRFDVEGDTKGKRTGFYLLHVDDHPVGVFGCNKRFGNEHKFHWTGKESKRLTTEERVELARRTAESRVKRLAEETVREAAAAARAKMIWGSATEADTHPYLTRKGVKGYGLRVGEWIRDRRDGTTYVAAKSALLVPMRDPGGMVSLQAIFAKPIGDDNRDKDFIYGGKKRGCWSTIGKPSEIGGWVTVMVCEGYATGATLHEATGLAVLVAFDAGNLIHVARELRRVMPDVRILIAGDNDRWTEKPINNPGLTRAREAAIAVDGEWVVPEFADLESKPTDFNDLHAREGKDEVLAQIMVALCHAPQEPSEDPPPWGGPESFDAPERNDEPELPAPPTDDDVYEDPRPNPYFSIRGHDRDNIFIYQHEMKMIRSRGLSDWSEAALTAIAPLNWWEVEFPGEKGMSRKMAVNWLQRQAFKHGFFDPDSCRGRGAWQDNGRHVYHFGHRLWVDGEIIDVTKIDSTYVYEQGKRLRLPASEPLSNKEGARLVETAQEFAWSRPASAILLAGWMALAPLGGALRWRPHIWITGGAGSGKSTILSEYLNRLIMACVYAQGNSTEAGIRQTLKTDSLAVIFDETEQNNEKEALRVQNVLTLIRQSSTESEAKTLKGTAGGSAMNFMIRSMFCLSSIQVGMKHQADIERVTVLSLCSKKDGRVAGGASDAADNWKRVSASLAWLKDPEIAPRLLCRSLELLPTTVRNIEIFAQAAAEKFGSQRDGDQYGALLAGAWSLGSKRLATTTEARAMIDRYDWSDYLEGSETEESDEALNALGGRLLIAARGLELNVNELIGLASERKSSAHGLSSDDARELLKRYDIRVEPEKGRSREVWVANKSTILANLMADTPYAADLTGQLLRIPGATRGTRKQRFSASARGYVLLPIDKVLGEDME